MKKCPKCKYTRKESDDRLTPSMECPSCGVIYSKYEAFINKKKPEKKQDVRPEATEMESISIEDKNNIGVQDSKMSINFSKNILNKTKAILNNKNKQLSLQKKAVICTIILVVSVWGFNYISLQRYMNNVISQDSRNNGLSVDVHYGNYINLNKLIYNLDRIGPNNSKADVFRVLLQFSAKMSSKKINYVILSCKGEQKFYFKGEYFNKIGREYSVQNPVYTMRTFAENLYNPIGEKAFPTWTGWLFGVMGKQMEDFNSFHEQWYWSGISK